MIGSGPAGCSAAVTCSKAGLQVFIVTDAESNGIEDATTIGPLESIHPGVSSLLERIGLGGAEQSSVRAIYEGINAGDVYTPLGEDANGTWKGMHINRSVFDDHLLQKTREYSIAVMTNERVEDFIIENDKVIGIKTNQEEIRAKFVIDATGKRSIAGKKLNFKRRFFSPPFICWTGVSEIDGDFPFDHYSAYFLPAKEGWTWLAPQPPHHFAWTRLAKAGEKSLLPPDILQTKKTVGKIHVANMRWRLYRPVCREGIILCGDAAGILDPAAGQGIFNALWSGMVAATTVISCLKEPQYEGFHLAQYDDWFTSQFEEKVKRLKDYYREHGIHLFGREQGAGGME